MPSAKPNYAHYEALRRVRQIAEEVRELRAFDLGVTTPPDWRPFVAALADEVAMLLEPKKQRRVKARANRK